MKKILLAGTALVALAATAQAADLSARRTAVPAAIAYAPAYSWSGIYGGLQIGGNFGNRTFSNTFQTDGGFNTGSGVSLGGQVGADFQSGAWVFGVVGDLAWTSTSQTVGATAYTLPYEGSARVRAGYLVSPQFLAYLTGGLAFGADTATTAGVANSRGHLGWTAGVGGEYMFAPSWSGFAEYRYTDLGYADWFGNSQNNTHHKVLLGVNYRFSTGPGAVVAKY
jgi:outer membrane immunogenic protein